VQLGLLANRREERSMDGQEKRGDTPKGWRLLRWARARLARLGAPRYPSASGSAVNEAGIREHPPLIRFPKSLEDLLSRWTIITLLTIGGTVFVASLVLFLVFLVNAGDSKWIVLALSLIGIVGSLLSLTVTGRLVSTRSTYLREADWFAEDLRAAIAAINRSSGTRRESLVEAARSAVGKANILVEYLIDAQEADLARSVRNGGP
jgi:hypothetical protein